MIDSLNTEPPLESQYLGIQWGYSLIPKDQSNNHVVRATVVEEEFNLKLPVIDLEVPQAAVAIREAASEWGFFQVVNHGISSELLRRMRKEQVKLFGAPFEKKANSGILGNSYRWGSIGGTRPTNFSWHEAFHIPLNEISDPAFYGELTDLR